MARVDASDAPTGETLIGRERELAAIRRLLGDATGGAAAVLLDGEPGVGKTSLWRAACAEASAASLPVLSTRAAETESGLPLVGLRDLLDVRLSDGTLARSTLPGLDQPFDAQRLGRAFLEVLADLTGPSPALFAIDDVQWLDVATEQVLAFVLRRAADLPLRILLAQRTGSDPVPSLDIDGALAPGHVVRLRVEGLGPEALDELLRQRLGASIAWPALVGIHAATGGNPMYALEMVAAAQRSGHPLDGSSWVVPRRLTELLKRGLDQAPEAVRDTVLVTAAAGTTDLGVLESALGGTRDIRRAIAGGWLERDGDRVRVRHPLIGTAVYGEASPAERRAAHRRLATCVPDPVERARHIGLASVEPDHAVAAELETAAGMAGERGSPRLAAVIAQHAARLTPIDDPPALRRRRYLAAEQWISAGDAEAAREVLEGLVAETGPGPERAHMLLSLADVVGDLDRTITLARAALDEAGDDVPLVARVHSALSTYVWLAGDLDGGLDHTRAAIDAAEAAGDEQRAAMAIGDLCHALVVLGRPWSPALMERALAIERGGGDFPPWLRPSFQLGVMYIYTDRIDEARPLILAELDRLHASGDEPGRVGVLFRIAELELRAGRWDLAARAAREAATLARSVGLEQEQMVAEMCDGWVRAHLGDLDAARALGTRALDAADRLGQRVVAARARGVLGLVELSAGRPTEALEWLWPGIEEQRAAAVGELSIAALPEQAIDALLALGRPDEARALCHELARAGAPTGRAWHAAVAERGLALAAADTGDEHGAATHLADAYVAHERLANPFTLARTHLAAGVIARRARRWADARRGFYQALELFDRLGAARWAERTATELGRLPGRPSGGTALTSSERAVAELVAQGLANKEIAGRLGIATRTVEHHVTNAYRKLGVDSRVALAQALGDVRDG